MRQELAQICDARVCLGGKLTNFSGRMPGVIEEAIYTVAVRRPLYVSEIFSAVRLEFSPTLSGVRAAYSILCQSTTSLGSAGISCQVPYLSLTAWNRKNQLDLNHRLRGTKSVDVCIELILRGLIKWWGKNREQILNERRERGWIY